MIVIRDTGVSYCKIYLHSYKCLQFFESIWAPLVTTLTTEFMYLLWMSLLVFVIWHDKVVCRRQQQQQEIIQFVFAFFSRSAFFIFRILPYVPQYFSASRIPHFTRSRFSAICILPVPVFGNYKRTHVLLLLEIPNVQLATRPPCG